ncbi:MAG TPA: sigma-70 family RNA polymerase sigma factor [Caldilineaceae bacterium]|nr:sigma-70 family RNA polymerase sigma factor [Caldilineaceae bacterium]
MPEPAAEAYTSYSDEALLRLVNRKDIRAYETLYDRHAQVVFNLLMRVMSDSAAAEELLQEVFWQIWQKADQDEGASPVAAWLYRVARNKALDFLRHRRARPQTVTSELETLNRSPRLASNRAENEVEQAWRRQQVTQALESIPGEQRLCLELAYFEGMSQREIAERTKTPLGTIKTRMRLGMEKLERILRAVGYIEGDVRR